MKRIIYKCRKINSGMKKWLNSNKIYFETVVMLILSITGIIISYMGVSVSKTANKLSYQANDLDRVNLELTQNEMLPILSRVENEYDDMFGYRYYMFNTGDDFFNPEFEIYAVISILVTETSSDEKGLYYREFYVRAVVPDFMHIRGYDAAQKRFEMTFPNYSEYTDLCDNLYSMLGEELDKRGDFVLFPYTIDVYLAFSYKDVYINEDHRKMYVLPQMSLGPLFPDEVLISDKSETEIKDLPKLNTNLSDASCYQEDVEILIDQFKDLFNEVPKGYYEIEINY